MNICFYCKQGTEPLDRYSGPDFPIGWYHIECFSLLLAQVDTIKASRHFEVRPSRGSFTITRKDGKRWASGKTPMEALVILCDRMVDNE